MKSSLILCLLFVAVCSASLTVTVKDLTVIVGETAVIPCEYETDSATSPKYTWSRITDDGTKDRLVVYQDGEATRIEGVDRPGLNVNSDGSLIVPNTQVTDNIELKKLSCEVEVGSVGSASQDLEFMVALLPEDPPTMTISDYGNRQKGFEILGFNVAIATCMSSPSYPPAMIKFFKDGASAEASTGEALDPILNAPNIDPSGDGVSSISSKDLMKAVDKTDHQANFICNIRTEYGDKVFERNYTMPKFNVLYPTSMVKFEEHPVAYLGQTITLKCIADGFPQPEITINSEDTSEKEITITEDMNGDSYQCSALYEKDPPSVKSENYTIQVFSISEPKIEGIEIADGVAQVEEGSDVTATCTATGNPKPSVAWYKGDSKVSADGTLNIDTAKFENSADYTCRATNGHDAVERSSSFKLDVRGLKLVGPEESDVDGKKDETVLIDCAVEANPEPKFSWNIKDLDESIVKAGYMFTSQVEVGPLSTELSEKVYECTIQNDDGVSIKKQFKLPVVTAGSGATTAIIIVVLLLILIVAIVLAVLYNKGIICKKEEKGDESAEKDIALELNNDEDDVEAGNGKPPAPAEEENEEHPPENIEEEKLMNGENRDD